MTISPEDLEVGDVFYECQYGINLEFVVKTPIVKSKGFEDRDTYDWTAVSKKGTTTNFRLTKGLEHYGPRIYEQPQYATIKNGEIDFIIE